MGFSGTIRRLSSGCRVVALRAGRREGARLDMEDLLAL
jgi:hypothetical protein